jgi:hypothetical protein
MMIICVDDYITITIFEAIEEAITGVERHNLELKVEGKAWIMQPRQIVNLGKSCCDSFLGIEVGVKIV